MVMRTLVPVVGTLCLALQALSGSLSAQDNLADIIERSEKSLVRIEVKSDQGESLGSGFVIDKGIIATNVHVLAGASSARAIFPDGRVVTIIGTLHVDAKRDIAIAKIDGVGVDQLPVLPFSSIAARKGERVVALGSPLGLSFSATSGVVSAIRTAQELGKELGDKELEGTWIQVDAALSPGNSGGPIINNAGEIVAMSTLASQGAQNLNFGISAQDVKTAKDLSAGRELTSLSQGVGKIKSREGRGGGGRGDRGIIDHREIPSAAVAAYVELGRTDFKSIVRDLNREIERLKGDLKQMRQGQTFIPPGVTNRPVDVVRSVNPAKRGARNWYFRNDSVKQRQIDAGMTRQKELTKISQMAVDPNNKDGLLTLLWKYGPRIDTRVNGSVGFLSEAIVLHAFNAHDALILYDDAPYLIYLESTAGLSLGQEVMPMPVFVSGTATAQVEDGSTSSFTVLQCLTKEELSEAIFGPSASPGSSPSPTPGASTPSTGGQVAGNPPKSTTGSAPSTTRPGAAGPSAPSSSTLRDTGSAAPRTGQVGRDGLYAPPSPTNARMWFDRTGKFSVEAVLLRKDDNEVVLRKLDGKVIRVPRASLCDSDQEYLRNH